MQQMDFDTWIEMPGRLTDQIIKLEDKAEKLRTVAADSAYRLNPAPQKATPTGSGMEKMITMAMDIDARVKTLREEREEYIAEITELLMGLENQNHMDVLIMRYISLCSFEKIATKIRYSKSHVFKLHRDGMTEARKLYNEKHNS